MFRFLLLAVCLSGVRVTALDQAYRKDVEAWRTQHELAYRKEYVPLGGLFPLKDGWNTVGSAANSDIKLPARMPASVGRFQLDDKQIRYEPVKGVTAIVRGFKVGATALIRNDGDKDGVDEISFGDFVLWVHMSGGRPTIRLRDPKGEAARSFRGFRWFAIDESYRVTARFIKDRGAARDPDAESARRRGGDDHARVVAEFTLNGQTVRLRPATTRPKRLWFIFRDGTSGQETYETARFLYADLLDDGTTVLDFNQAYNPPCAFNPYTTCPIPIPENRAAGSHPRRRTAYSK